MTATDPTGTTTVTAAPGLGWPLPPAAGPATGLGWPADEPQTHDEGQS